MDNLQKENVIIKVDKLKKTYDNRDVLCDLNFYVKSSEIFVILGKSGVGKSTLLNIIAKLDEEYSGNIIYSESLYKDKNVPYPVVFQEFDQLLPWYNVKKNILLPLKSKKMDNSIEGIVKFLALSNHLDKLPSELSGGMKQRAAIARALICDGDIIFMDEPFGSLDFSMRKNLQLLIKEIKIKYSKTILFITHDIEEAIFIADRILILKDNHRCEILDISKSNIENTQSKKELTEYIKNQLTL